MSEMIEPIPVDGNTVLSENLSDHSRGSDLNDISEYGACFLVELSWCQWNIACVVWAAQSWIVGIQVDQRRNSFMRKPLGPEESPSYDCIRDEVGRSRSGKHDLQTGSTRSSVVFNPVGADVVPSSVFAVVLSVWAHQLGRMSPYSLR
jgi:hypothetical protein